MKYSAKILLAIGLLAMLSLVGHTQTERVYEVRDFGGGMITDYDAEDLPANAGVWASDCDLHRGQLGPRQGYVVWRDINKWVWDFINYDVSMPPGVSTGVVPDRKITLYHARTNQGDSLELESCYMYPTYTKSANNVLGDGTWANTLSADLNTPQVVYQPHRFYRLRSSGWSDYVVGRNDIRIAAGASYGTSGHDIVANLNANYTYPWWLGYIDGWRWQGYRHKVDGFFLEGACLVPPAGGNPSGNFFTGFVHKDTTYTSPDGNSLTAGRYFFKIIFIYDGYQASTPMNYQNLYSDITGDSLIGLTFWADTTDVEAGNRYGNDPSYRVTALEIFAAGPYQSSGYQWVYRDAEWFQVVWKNADPLEWNSLPYKLVKHVGISDVDTTQLGYVWKSPTSRYLWKKSSTAYVCTVYVDKDDMDGNGVSLSTRLGYEGNEIFAAPRYMAELNGQTWNGNVYIGSPNSKVNQGWSNMVIISPVFQPDVMAINNFITVGAGQGQGITGMRAWNGQMLIWTKDALEVWSAGTIPALVRRYDGYGMSAPNSIQTTQNGVFYASLQAIYMYNGSIYDLTGAVGPQGSVRPIEAVYDSIASATVTSGGIARDILNYCESAYIKDQEKYVLIYDTLNVAVADTFEDYEATTPVWGGIYPPFKTGGRKMLTYDLKTGAWTRGQFSDKFQSVFGDYSNKIYAFCRTDEALYELFTGNLDSTDKISSVWKSGWLDFGAPGIQKDLIGVGLDYELSANAAVDTSATAHWQDTVRITIYVDGRTTAYGTFDFYASDSTLATIDADCRRVQFVKGDSSGVTISDPIYGLPVMFQAQLNWGGALAYTSNPGKINALRFYWTEGKRRQ